MTGKIAIFPASGALGTSTYTHLLKFVPPQNVVLISRHPEKYSDAIKASGVTTRTADYQSPETFLHAFDGVSCLNLISYPSIQHEFRFNAHRAAIDAAINSGVSHIIYSSLAFGGPPTQHTSRAHVMQAHIDTENYLAAKSASANITYTVVRQGIYSETFPMYIAFYDVKAPVKEVLIPHDGSHPGVAWAKRDELGEATARLIQTYVDAPQDFPHTNKSVVLSGAKEYSLADTVKVASDAAGLPAVVKTVSLDEYVAQPHVRAALSSHGPGEVTDQWATVYEAIRQGETAVVSPLLEQLLGRKPETFEKTVADIVRLG